MPSKGLILVVEDEDSIRLSLRDYLTKKGYEILVASDGVGALKQLLDFDVDLIVSDYRMDVLGGDYWIKFLMKYCSGKRIIITSGFLRPDFDIPFDVIYKPFDYQDLEKRIAALLEAAPGGRALGGAIRLPRHRLRKRPRCRLPLFRPPRGPGPRSLRLGAQPPERRRRDPRRRPVGRRRGFPRLARRGPAGRPCTIGSRGKAPAEGDFR
jgi:CheY-like chemotaxis protein